MAFDKNLDEFGTPQGVERLDRFAREVWDKTTFPLFCFLGQEESGICGGTIAAWGGGPSKFCIHKNCGFAHLNKAWGTLLLGGIYVQVLDKHALFDQMLPLEAAD